MLVFFCINKTKNTNVIPNNKTTNVVLIINNSVVFNSLKVKIIFSGKDTTYDLNNFLAFLFALNCVQIDKL